MVTELVDPEKCRYMEFLMKLYPDNSISQYIVNKIENSNCQKY